MWTKLLILGRGIKFFALSFYCFVMQRLHQEDWLYRIRHKSTAHLSYREKFKSELEKKRYFFNVDVMSVTRGSNLKRILRDQYLVILDIPGLGLGNYLFYVVGAVWFCQKAKIAVKVEMGLFEQGDCFINRNLGVQRDSEKYRFGRFFGVITRIFALYVLPSEYGHEVLKKLTVKREFVQDVDQWCAQNLKTDHWVAVHYRGGRGTDVFREILPQAYIKYLKEVIDKRCDIVVCSDFQPFVDGMRSEFPSRVFARDCQRTSDKHHPLFARSSHLDLYDAATDILLLSKAKLVYTTGSTFTDIARFFNPSIKIISLFNNFKKQGKLRDNYLAIPQKDYLDSLLGEEHKNTHQTVKS